MNNKLITLISDVVADRTFNGSVDVKYLLRAVHINMSSSDSVGFISEIYKVPLSVLNDEENDIQTMDFSPYKINYDVPSSYNIEDSVSNTFNIGY